MLFLSLAYRNFLRNSRRTIATIVAIAFSSAALVFAWGAMDGQNVQMIATTTGSITGHVQIHRTGYVDRPSLDLTFKVEDLPAVLSDDKRIVASARRLAGPVMVISDTNARGIQIVGIDPREEVQVTDLHQKMAAGHYLRAGDRRGIVIGEAFAKLMGVSLGSEIGVMTEGMHGAFGAQRYRVQGIFHTGNQTVDQWTAYLTLDDAAELFSTGGRITEVALKLERVDEHLVVVPALVAQIGDSFEVHGWPKLLPFVADSVRFHESLGVGLTLLLYGVAALGIATALLMSVVQRVPQFGVMMALGTTPWQVFRSIVYEGLILALTGVAIGLLLGATLVTVIAHVGLDFSHAAEGIESREGLTSVIRPVLLWSRVPFVAVVVIVITLLAALYPAFKAARLSPLVAIHSTPWGSAGGARRGRSTGNDSSRSVLVALAVGNLRRTPGRTALLFTSIALCLATAVFFESFVAGFYERQIENALGLVSGHVQIMRTEFRREQRPSLAFEANAAHMKAIRELPQVEAASRRVAANVLIQRAGVSEQLDLIGIEPQHESEVTFVQRAIREGRGIEGVRDIVIDRKLADKLDARLGEKLVVSALDVNGRIAAEAFTIVGIYWFGDSADWVGGIDTAYVHLAGAQRLLSIGEKVTGVAVKLAGTGEPQPAVLSALQAALPVDGVQALPWPVIVPELVHEIDVSMPWLKTTILIVYVIAGLIVMNTVLMALMERAREFGTLLAIGASPREIVRMVGLESALLGFCGVLAGLVLGGGLAAYGAITGLHMWTETTAIRGVTDIIRPQVSALSLSWPAAALFVIVMLASLYPAWRISRINALAAIRRT